MEFFQSIQGIVTASILIIIDLFASANAATGPFCKPGKAKVTQTAKGAKHPYHLVKVTGGGSTVYGWVDTADIDVTVPMSTDTAPTRSSRGTRYGGWQVPTSATGAGTRRL